MQLIDTHVEYANEGLVTVEFRGEGGDLFCVKMTSGVDIQSDSAVTRNKAVMIQPTTFAEDCDPPQDKRDQFQDLEASKSASRPSGAKSDVPVFSSFSDTPSSAVPLR
jgi:hypothetical protein